VAQLSIALTILVAAVLGIYAVERIYFRQQPARAASKILFAGACSDVGFIFASLVLIALMIFVGPLTCLYAVQRMIVGRRRAATMQPAVLLRRIGLALSTASPASNRSNK
jgi:hypothetical protein